MTGRRVWAAIIVVAMLACVVPAIAIPIAHRELLGLFAPDLGAAISFTLVGAFLLIRGTVGRLAVIMCVQGVGASLTVLTGVLKNLAAESGPLRGVDLWVAWLNNFVWLPGVILLTPLVLLFPDGRLASRRWRWPIVAVALLGATFVVTGVIDRVSVLEGKPYDFAPNPTGFVSMPRLDAVGFGAFVGLIACFAISIASLVARRRRAHGVQRTQLTCFFYGVTVSVVLLAGLSPIPDPGTTVLIFIAELFSVAPIAMSIAVAVLRYRLFDIDRVVSRTVAYVLVLAVLAGVYIGVVTGLAALVPDRYGSVGVAIATLTVAALAVPLTRRVRRVVDRRFNRSRFDAERVAAAFATRLRSRPDHGDVPAELLEVVQRTVAPTHASVWLASG